MRTDTGNGAESSKNRKGVKIMDYQKIIILGKIVSKPEIKKTEEGVLDQVTFQVSFKNFSENEIVFPVKAIGEFKNKSELHKGTEILIEGALEKDKSGELFIFADYFQSGNSGKLLF
jgi:uncharacterized protein YdeI (BOF family)